MFHSGINPLKCPWNNTLSSCMLSPTLPVRFRSSFWTYRGGSLHLHLTLPSTCVLRGMDGPNYVQFVNNFLVCEGLGLFLQWWLVIFRKAYGSSSCLSVCNIQGIFSILKTIIQMYLLLVVASYINEAKERKSVLGQLSFICSMWKIRGIKLHQHNTVC